MTEVFGTDTLFDAEDFVKLVTRMGVNLAFTTLVIAFVYNRLYRNREFVFTYYIFNIVTFSLCVLLRKVPMELGFALGLFAVFGILRYRTEPIRMRDLTYLFVVIGIAILNGVTNKKVSLAEVLVVNAVITALVAVVELQPGRVLTRSTPMLYDKIDLLRPGCEAALLRDITDRTGFTVVHVLVHRVDMLRDAADITVYYQGGK